MKQMRDSYTAEQTVNRKGCWTLMADLLETLITCLLFNTLVFQDFLNGARGEVVHVIIKRSPVYL